MIDLNLRDFANTKDRLDRGLKGTLPRTDILTHGYSLVLLTGNDYHIYQLMG